MKLFSTIMFFSMASILVFQDANAVESAEALAKANNCLLCHSVAAAIIGPAYKDVAKKYKGDAAG